jgi:hypothetical protein
VGDDDADLELFDCWAETVGRELGRVALACRLEPRESAEGRVLVTGVFSSSVAQPPVARSRHPRANPRHFEMLRRCRNPVLSIMAGLLSLPGPPVSSGLFDLPDRRSLGSGILSPTTGIASSRPDHLGLFPQPEQTEDGPFEVAK